MCAPNAYARVRKPRFSCRASVVHESNGIIFIYYYSIVEWRVWSVADERRVHYEYKHMHYAF